MDNSSSDPHGIEDFLTQHRNNHHSTDNWVGGQPVSLDETRTGGSATVPYSTPNTTSFSQSMTPRTTYTSSDYASNSQYQSTMAGVDGGYYQYSSAPSVWSVTDVGSTASNSDGVRIPCEFVGWHMCNETFSINDFDGWCSHVTDYHLSGKLPREMLCWFCDEKFVAESKGRRHLHTNLQNRLVHIIQQHIRNGAGEHDIRVDWDFLEHLRRHAIISQQQYKDTRDLWRDTVTYPDGNRREVHHMEDIRPSNWTSASEIARHERASQVPVDTRKEDRQRRHEKHHRDKPSKHGSRR